MYQHRERERVFAAWLCFGITILSGVVASWPSGSLAGSGARISLYVLRTLPLLNGVSIAWPFLCLLAIGWIWTATRMNVLWIRHSQVLRASAGGREATVLPVSAILGAVGTNDAFDKSEQGVVDAALRRGVRASRFELAAGILLPLVVFALKPPTILEPFAARNLFVFLLVIATALIVSSLMQVIRTWRALRTFLQRVRTGAAGPWLRTISASFKEEALFELPTLRSRGLDLARLANLLIQVDDPKVADLGERTKRELDQMHAAAVESSTSDRSEGAELGPLLSQAASILAAGAARPSLPTRRFVGSMIAFHVRAYVRILGVAMIGIVAKSMCLLLCIEGYAFEPHRLLVTCFWAILIAVLVTGAWVLVGTNKDEILSRFTNTEPGKLDPNWEFVGHAVRWLGLPLVATIAAQYPRVTGSFLTLLEPLFRALR